jgi:hypothetical protein
MGDCRRWNAEMEEDRDTPTFEEWIRGAMRTYAANAPTEVDVDSLMLCTKPSQKAMRYTKMKAFENHFRVLDDTTNRMQTYDSGIASVFDVPTEDAQDVSINYVGMLRDILKLDYEPMLTPVILLRCEWIKRSDNRGNPTYVRDETGFLVVNFRHKLPSMCDPFIFPNQATQVFFSDDLGKVGWKVVLWKEPRARREVADTSDVFISTSVETSALTAPAHIPPPPTIPSLDGTITLSVEENLLASASY